MVTCVPGVSGCSVRSVMARLTRPGLPGFPTCLRIHPCLRATPEDPLTPVLEYSRSTGTNQAPMMKGSAMSDRSPRQTMSKKSGKSLKEKRADKHVKVARRAAATEASLRTEKR